MHRQIVEGNWMELEGKAREMWGHLTDDDVDVIAGKREVLIGRIKERYGRTADEVTAEVEQFDRSHLGDA